MNGSSFPGFHFLPVANREALVAVHRGTDRIGWIRLDETGNFVARTIGSELSAADIRRFPDHVGAVKWLAGSVDGAGPRVIGKAVAAAGLLALVLVAPARADQPASRPIESVMAWQSPLQPTRGPGNRVFGPKPPSAISQDGGGAGESRGLICATLTFRYSNSPVR
jgi:hypothetical protein